MKLEFKEGQQAFYDHSGKVSDICRQLCLAGFAFLWLLVKKGDTEGINSSSCSITAFIMFMVCMFLDAGQYAYCAIKWNKFTKDRPNAKANDEFELPDNFTDTAYVFFFAKCVFCIIGYAFTVAEMFSQMK